jgi:glycosyltransferase involved in cell wall biosynthesis
MSNDLHIVTPDVPSPADGDILRNIYFKIKAFHKAGINIHLHSFEFGKGQLSDLEPYCIKIKYYRRNNASQSMIASAAPYCVASRSNIELAKNLFADDYPILYEGIGTTFPVLRQPTGQNKVQILSLGRDDEKYYRNLSALVPFGFNKLTYLNESRKCKSYIKKLQTNTNLVISEGSNYFGDPDYSFTEKKGTYCLYFGKLSDRENEYAALWLLENIFNDVEIPFVIAGSNPSAQLDQAAHLRLHTCLVADPGEKELKELIKKAQLVLIPSFIDIPPVNRLMLSMSLGKHVLINPKASGNSGLEKYCSVASTPDQFKEKILQLSNANFLSESHNARQVFISNEDQDNHKIDALITNLNLHCR